MVSFHEVKDVVSDVLITCSALHTFLPPYDAEAFAPFPTFKKYYRVVIYVVGYVGINFRSTIYKSISIENPQGLNKDKCNGK